MQYHYTYLIVQEDTGEFYVGVRTSKVQPFDDRDYMGSPIAWKKMPTYDLSKQTKIVLSVYSSREEANKNEIILIDKFKNDPLNRNYHVPAKGFCNQGLPVSEETKRKMSRAGKGRPKSEEHKRKMSEAHKGEKNGFYGKTHSEEFRKKIGEVLRDNTIYNWIHVDSTQISCTRYELYTTYNLDSSGLRKVIKGKRKSYKGWKLNSSI